MTDSTDASHFKQLRYKANRVFTPAAPISEEELFAGRISQVNTVIDAINQPGQHVIIYGERGVGKTSLANVLSSRVMSRAGTKALAPRINCDATDTFDTLWRKVLSEVTQPKVTRTVGFGENETQSVQVVSDLLPQDGAVTPNAIRKLIAAIGADGLLLVILDEFDRLAGQKVRRAIADTIKTFSDHSVPATVVLVGVADTVGELISEHQSIERALVQVLMPRMTTDELHEILEKGTGKLEMTIRSDAKKTIAALSQGLPHYTHQLALQAAHAALDKHRLDIQKADIKPAIQAAVARSQQSLQETYRKAILSPQKDNLYGRVLLACARAKTDSFGYFAAADVRAPMSAIMKKRYDIPSFAKHLNDFCGPGRGSVLRKDGVQRRYRYRFCSPLMPPFVVMKGILDGLILA